MRFIWGDTETSGLGKDAGVVQISWVETDEDFNEVAQFDSDYRGEVLIGLHNDRRAKFSVRNGDRIAQGRIIPVPRVIFEFVDELSTTARGTGGLGSTGK
jgi:dUTPase